MSRGLRDSPFIMASSVIALSGVDIGRLGLVCHGALTYFDEDRGLAVFGCE
jgi:hypothetical protein